MIKTIRQLLSVNVRVYNFSATVYHELRYISQKAFYRITKGVPVYRTTDLDRSKYKSQFGQDFLIDTVFLSNSQEGFFVEIGANDPVQNSNTFFFEVFRGYSGLSVDAIDFGESYRKLRPKTKFVNAVISSKEREVDFNFVEPINGWEDQLSGIDTSKLAGKNLKIRKQRVNTTRLDRLLNSQNSVDIMIVDVEGHEMEVMSSFDLRKIRPKLIICENSGPLREHRTLQDFMSNSGYRLVARIWTADDVYIPEELNVENYPLDL